MNFLPSFDRKEKWGRKKGTDLPKIIELVNDTETIRTQVFWPHVLSSFCSNVMAFVCRLQPCSPRACWQESSDNGSDCLLATALQGHWNPPSSALSHSKATLAHSSQERTGCANRHCCPAKWTETSCRDKVESRNLIPCCLEVENKASLEVLLLRVGSPSEYKWQPPPHATSYSRGRQTAHLVGKTHDLDFNLAIKYIFNSSPMQFG